MDTRRWLMVGLFVAGTFLSLSECLLEHQSGPASGSITFAGQTSTGSQYFRLLTAMADLQASVDTAGHVSRFGVSGLALTSRRLPSWLYVGPVTAEVPLPDGSAMRRFLHNPGGKAETLCLWTHPPDKGPLVLTWESVPTGVFDGYLYFLPSADDKGRISVDIRFDNSSVRKYDFRVKHGKAERLVVDLPGSVPGSLTIVLEAKATGRNHVCIDGVVDEVAR